MIARLGGDPLTEFPTYLTFGAANDAALATAAAKASGTELRALGFTMVFAPVADVTVGPADPTIGSRSAGSHPRVVAEQALASSRGYAAAGIVPVLKHFPGHGSVPTDSHRTLPEQDAPLSQLRERDLVPFAVGAANGVPAVMVAHIDVADVDPGTPSSLSTDVITGLLRTELGFDGLVVTDALNMAAIADGYGSGDAAVAALRAGADLLLMPPDISAAHAAIPAALDSGALPVERLDDAATTVVATAMRQDRLTGKQPARSVLGRGHAQSYAASLAAVTVVSGPCGKHRYVGDEVQVVGGSETDRARFTAAAERAGLRVGSAGDVVHLLEYGSSIGSGDVVVALDTPYGLGASDANTAAIALYGRTPDAFRALVDVLIGAQPARGTLPVRVDGVDRTGCPAKRSDYRADEPGR